MKKLSFSIEYHTRWGESLAVVVRDRKYPLRWSEGDVWKGTFEVEDGPYRYVVIRDGIIARTEWDVHDTHSTRDSWIDAPEGCPFNTRHSAAIFDRPGFRGAGTAIPVFSLRSSEDFGIGEFHDLHLLIDWAASTGQCLIQLLPVNDTTRRGTWDDSYPYSPISSFALNPMYIHLQDLGIKEDAEFKRLRKDLDTPELDYPKVFLEKTRLMRKAFEKADLKDKAYRKFASENADWLEEYCAFCAKRDGDSPEFHSWIQFQLDKQLSAEVRYAHLKGVYLKGDLPIGISGDSADAFYHPELFNLDSCAGAPPDFFSKDGQNWGFPTYNWDAMEADGFRWWKRRLRKMAEYFDAFRIDHILGFFRIWEIPADRSSGMFGHFNPALPYSGEELKGLPLDGLFHEDPRHPGCYQPLISPASDKLDPESRRRFDAIYDDFFFHRHDAFWKRAAERKLPELLGATGMLACGEDLGMIPPCVPEVMDRECILSLEMPMMDKGRNWPHLSVCTTSSHDMFPLRAQREKDPTPEECALALSGCLLSRSMLAVFPLQDWLSVDGALRASDPFSERINDPANPHHHWRWRMHFDLEKLKTAEDFSSTVSTLIKSSGR